MGKQVLICGVDCHPGDENCNGYCTGKADCPADAPEALVLIRAAVAANNALNVAEKAWYDYAGLCAEGPHRTRAFDVYRNIQMARHTGA
jgi:hypothetical protein